MSENYDSLFDKNGIITKKEMCALLNLNTSRPGLVFSAAEIRKAYRKRAFRFHPDRQRNYPESERIDTKMSAILMNDIELAREHLLNGDDFIRGKHFTMPDLHQDQATWIKTFASNIDGFASSLPYIDNGLYILSWLSADYTLIPALATFSDGKPLLRFVNQFADEIDLIRPIFRNIDGSTASLVLRSIQWVLRKNPELTGEKLANSVEALLPSSVTESEDYPELRQAIEKSGQELTSRLRDDKFVKSVEYLLKFWPNFLANVPTWKYIVSVYLSTLALTATSLPKYYNAFKVTEETIYRHKGGIAFALTVIPASLMALVMLPVNLLIQLSWQIGLVALNAAAKLLYNALKCVGGILQLILLPLNFSLNNLAQVSFTIFEGLVNGTARLMLNTLVDLADTLLYIFTGKYQLELVDETVNNLFDGLLNKIRPEKKAASAANHNQNIEKELDEVRPVETQDQTNPNTPEQVRHSFFSGLPLFGEEDAWWTQFKENYLNQEAGATYAA